MTKDVFCNGTKETWRGTMLNECFRRLPTPGYLRRQLKVLTLVGPQDRDGHALVKRGIDRRNILAVDVDDGCVSSARKDGAIAVCARVQDVLLSLGANDRLDLVLLDLMGGVTDEFMRLVFALHGCRALHEKSVVMLNLLAGRDPHAAILGDGLHKDGRKSPHRGAVAFDAILCAPAAIMHERGRWDQLVEFESLKREVVSYAAPWYDSYRSFGSNGIPRRYDTCVFTWYLRGHGISFNYTDKRRAAALTRAKRKISAAKAIRTMKLSGTLK